MDELSKHVSVYGVVYERAARRAASCAKFIFLLTALMVSTAAATGQHQYVQTNYIHSLEILT